MIALPEQPLFHVSYNSPEMGDSYFLLYTTPDFLKLTVKFYRASQLSGSEFLNLNEYHCYKKSELMTIYPTERTLKYIKGEVKMNLYKECKKIDDIISAFKELELNHNLNNQSAGIKSSYSGWKWTVRKCDEFPIIINAIPPVEEMEKYFWEEWYMQDKKVHHHILYLIEPDSYDQIFEAPQTDDIHPPEIMSKKWYVLEDQDMSLFLTRE